MNSHESKIFSLILILMSGTLSRRGVTVTGPWVGASSPLLLVTSLSGSMKRITSGSLPCPQAVTWGLYMEGSLRYACLLSEKVFVRQK